ncbi:MAG: 3-oxoacyl-ACP reductase FabG [bacterium]|jgi:3-oxoacyl-[acyl-carrier protein] reductase
MNKEIALITGASRGIGRAVAVSLGSRGWHVIVNFLSRRDAAEETLKQVTEAGGTGELLPFDVANYAACETAVQQCIATHGHIDVLINNAGIRKDELLVWTDPESWRAVIDTDLTSFYNVTRPVVKEMLLKRKGRIVTVSSTSGRTGLPGQVSYSAAKAGLIGATKALAKEVAKRHVTVNAVCPGFIDTEMIGSMDHEALLRTIPLGRLGTAHEVGETVAFLCGEAAAYITGSVIDINGGIYT